MQGISCFSGLVGVRLLVCQIFITLVHALFGSSVVFQLAKLCSLLLKAIRQLTGDLGWDTLMPGLVHGTLVEVLRASTLWLTTWLSSPLI